MRALALKRQFAGVVAAMWLMLGAGIAAAAEDAQYKTAGGLSAYLGVVPAELVKGLRAHAGEKPMHGRTPKEPHEFHVVVAIFDAGTGARVSDATVTASVSGLGLSGAQRTLEPMKIADTITYGAFFNLGPDIYTISVSVRRPGAAPVVLDFKYDHRR
jgi:hypothetical protein